MPMSVKEMKKLFEQHGWQELRQSGSHVIMGKGPLRETIPMHREIKKGLEMSLFKRLGVKK
jgi:predicted RNA binding protein YcfA (HicA-like mRNA interferase family)